MTDREQMEVDVLIVGAGPAGIVAAERARAAGLRVLVLDGGPRLARAPRPQLARPAPGARPTCAPTRHGRPPDSGSASGRDPQRDEVPATRPAAPKLSDQVEVPCCREYALAVAGAADLFGRRQEGVAQLGDLRVSGHGNAPCVADSGRGRRSRYRAVSLRLPGQGRPRAVRADAPGRHRPRAASRPSPRPAPSNSATPLTSTVGPRPRTLVQPRRACR